MLSALLLTIYWTSVYEVHYYLVSSIVGGTVMTASFLCTLSQFFSLWAGELSPAICFCYFIIAVLLLYTGKFAILI